MFVPEILFLQTEEQLLLVRVLYPWILERAQINSFPTNLLSSLHFHISIIMVQNIFQIVIGKCQILPVNIKSKPPGRKMSANIIQNQIFLKALQQGPQLITMGLDTFRNHQSLLVLVI